jgi:hypothetical protein
MRLAFSLMCAYVERFGKLRESFHYKIGDPITSFTKNALTNPPFQRYYYYDFNTPDWNVEWKCYNPSEGLIDFFSIRQDALDMSPHADFIFMLDDEFVFKEGSTEVINQCCRYLYDNTDCGAIYLAGNFGGEGDHHGDEIYITNNKLLSLNRGIVLRNKPVNMDNRLHGLGWADETVIGFTNLIQGYYLARRMHVPIEHDSINWLSEDNKNLNYNTNYIINEGIGVGINRTIGKWNKLDVWPENIFNLYRQAAMLKGFVPKYDVDGSVL